MNKDLARSTFLLAASLGCAAGAHARPDPIVNGGFESGLTGWTILNQVGSDGTIHWQSGTTSPANGFSVPAPPEGIYAAMTDSVAGGSHVMYQDFFVPIGVTAATLECAIFIHNFAMAFSTPAHLDWATPALNQQARVDLITTGADPFSVAGADVLQNIFQTTVGSPLTSGYSVVTADVTAVLAAHGGETLRLRFAEVDNVSFFNLGIDDVRMNIVPSPASSWAVMACFPAFVRRRSRLR